MAETRAGQFLSEVRTHCFDIPKEMEIWKETVKCCCFLEQFYKS